MLATGVLDNQMTGEERTAFIIGTGMVVVGMIVFGMMLIATLQADYLENQSTIFVK